MRKTIKIPTNYGEWVDLIEELKAKTGDEFVLAAFQQGTLEWQTGVAERFYEKLSEAVSFRINKASDTFQRMTQRSNGGEGQLVQAIIALRKEMNFLYQIVDLQFIPDDYRSQLKEMVKNQTEAFQKSLTDSAKNDRSGRLAQIVRNHKIEING